MYLCGVKEVIDMEKTQVLSRIKQVASQVLPKGSSLYLYSSRANYHCHAKSNEKAIKALI